MEMATEISGFVVLALTHSSHPRGKRKEENKKLEEGLERGDGASLERIVWGSRKRRVCEPHSLGPNTACLLPPCEPQ